MAGSVLPEQGFELLRRVTHAFVSATGPGDVTVLTARWSRRAVGGAAHPRLFLTGPALSACRDVPRSVDLRLERRADPRQVALQVVPHPEAEGRGVAAFPLCHHGSFLGILEVEGLEDALRSSLPVLDCIASHAAASLGNLQALARRAECLDLLDEAIGLGASLTGAGDPHRAVSASVSFLQRRLGVPVAVWKEIAEDGPLRLLTVRGLGSAGRRRLQRVIGSLPRWATAGTAARRSAERCFAAATGRRGAPHVLDAGAALLMFPQPEACDAETCDHIVSVLGGSIEHLFAAERAARRYDQLDLGLALTAHELRGPILGVKAALESVGGMGADLAARGEERDVIARSSRELGQLAAMTDALLRWSSARRSLSFESVDVALLVKEAIESFPVRSLGADRVRFHSAGPARVPASADHLRSAVANLVRNALAYSPADTVVDVAVRSSESGALVTVRDAGQGVAADELEEIFDPFVRGQAARTKGHGLGLYLARSVVEGHGGSLWVESGPADTTFFMSLPAGDEGRLTSAS